MCHRHRSQLRQMAAWALPQFQMFSSMRRRETTILTRILQLNVILGMIMVQLRV